MLINTCNVRPVERIFEESQKQIKKKQIREVEVEIYGKTPYKISESSRSQPGAVRLNSGSCSCKTRKYFPNNFGDYCWDFNPLRDKNSCTIQLHWPDGHRIQGVKIVEFLESSVQPKDINVKKLLPTMRRRELKREEEEKMEEEREILMIASDLLFVKFFYSLCNRQSHKAKTLSIISSSTL